MKNYKQKIVASIVRLPLTHQKWLFQNLSSVHKRDLYYFMQEQAYLPLPEFFPSLIQKPPLYASVVIEVLYPEWQALFWREYDAKSSIPEDFCQTTIKPKIQEAIIASWKEEQER